MLRNVPMWLYLDEVGSYPDRMASGPRRTRIALFLFLSFLIAACGSASFATNSSGAATPDTTSAAPLLSDEFTTLSGETIDLGSLEGQDTVLWFWSPW